jgi:hypothetical protein
MNLILIPTVPHTGTHFMRALFKGQHKIQLDHIWPERTAMWRELLHKGHPIVVPMRHPFEVAESWKRRGKDPLEIPELWRLLVQEIDKYNPQYLCLDVPLLRNGQLKAINNRLHLNLATDWARVCENGINPLHTAYRVRLTDDELAITDGIVEELATFFGRWYRDVKLGELGEPGELGEALGQRSKGW